MAIIKKAYGRAPERFYFIGGSQGGHEALDAAARYPNDYDGVVAHYPAYNVTLLHLGSLNVGRALYDGGGAAWINPAEDEADHRRGLREVRPLDGAKDGIISNVKACNTAFDVKTLRCANGADTGDTLSVRRAARGGGARSLRDYKPGFAIAGMDTFPSWALLEGALVPRADRTSARCRSRPIRCPARSRCSIRAGDQTAKFIITRNPEARHDDVRSEAVSGSASATVASIMDVTDVSLEKFRRRAARSS